MNCLAFFHLEHHVQPWIEAGGYGALFGLLFACGLGLLIPEDVPIITAGILIAQGHMHWALAAPIAWLGIIGGDCMLYSLSYKYGYNITRVPIIGRHVTMHRIKRAEVLFEKYGILVVGIGRMFAGIRGAMVIAAGTTRFNFIRFIIADGLGAIVSGGVFMILGYAIGAHMETLKHRAHEFMRGLTVFAVLAGVALIFYIRWRSKQHTSITDVVVDRATAVAPPDAVGDKK